MNALKSVFKFLLGLIAVLLIISLFLPSKVHVERTALIKGNPETVFKLVSNLEDWEKWSPWHRIDPNMKLEYSAVKEGVGAEYHWKSDDAHVGNGSIKIAEAKPSSYIKTEMNFMENGVASSEYFFTATPEGTQVKWTMDSDMGWNPVGRYMGLFMDGMIGKDYERGLHFLDSVAQITKVEEFKMDLEMGTIPEQKLLLIKAVAKEAEIAKVLGEIYGKIGGIIQENSLQMTGSPMAIYDDPQDGTFTFEAGMPVDKKPEKQLPKDIIYKEIASQPCVITHFFGPYEKTGAAYPAMQALIAENGKSIAGKPLEFYVSDPAEAKTPFDIKTDIYWPVK